MEEVKFKVISVNRHRMTVDGAGITTLIGLEGCPLSCKYCINKKILDRHEWRTLTPEELAKEIMQDYCYFVASGGGVTFGGGESLLHAQAIAQIRSLLPEIIHINVETSLQCSEEAVKVLIPIVSEWIIDIKTMDSENYLAYTGCKIDRMLSNLQLIRKAGIQDRCRIRVPKIPDYTKEGEREQSVALLKEWNFKQIDEFDYVIKKF